MPCGHFHIFPAEKFPTSFEYSYYCKPNEKNLVYLALLCNSRTDLKRSSRAGLNSIHFLKYVCQKYPVYLFLFSDAIMHSE